MFPKIPCPAVRSFHSLHSRTGRARTLAAARGNAAHIIMRWSFTQDGNQSREMARAAASQSGQTHKIIGTAMTIIRTSSGSPIRQ